MQENRKINLSKKGDFMLGKKMMCFALGVGVGIGATYLYNNNRNTVDQKVRCLKRKLKKLEREMANVLNGLKPEQMQKYKSEIETKFKEIKDKIENLTIKDIKDSAGNTLNSIKENIKNLSNKISSYMSNNSSNQC